MLSNEMDTYETHILVKKGHCKPSNPTMRIMKPVICHVEVTI